MPSQYLQATYHITRSLISLESLPVKLQITVDCLAEVLHAQQVALVVFDLTKSSVTHFVQSGVSNSNLERWTFEDWMHNMGSWALQGTTPDSPATASNSSAPHSHLHPRTSITMPVVYRERILGVLSATPRPDSPPFSDQQQELLLSIASQLALTVENERLAAAERQQRQRADTLREVARLLNYSLDQQRVLELILEQLERVVDYDSASIMLINEGQLSVVAQRKFRSPDQSILPFQIEVLTHIQEVLNHRLPVIISDTTQDPRWKEFPPSYYIRCWLGVPLIGREQVIGLLNLDKEQPGYYDQQDAALAATFANQAAIAIENARLYTSERQRAEQLDALRATVADLSAELELSRLLSAILERAATLLEASGGDLGLYDEISQEILIVVSHNMGKDYAGTRMKIGEGAMGLAIQTRQPVIIDEYAEWENASWQYKEVPCHAVIAVPFLIGKKVVGTIGIVDANPERRFSAADEHLLNLFAQHAAIAVENAHLYQAARQAAERRTILHKISQEIVTANLDPEDIYKAIHQACANLMPAEAFAITQFDQARQTIDAVYLFDRSGRVPSTSIPPERGLSGRILAKGRSIYIPDTLDANQLGDAIHFGDPQEVRSVLAVPMRLRGKVTGMLSAQSYQPEAYTDEDQYLLEMLAAYAAIALENAQLFIQLQQLAIVDPLTGVYNRRHLFELGQREFHRAKRFNRALSVIMLDIDHFKLVNDTYGHATGDVVLHDFAQLLRTNTREIDIVGRYGGEEFVIILPETSLEFAQLTAERLRNLIAEGFKPTSNGLTTISASFGIAELSERIHSFPDLVNLADAAMYDAKTNGRNQVAVRCD